MKHKIVIKTKKAFNNWLDVNNLFAKSMCERSEILRQFNALSAADRVNIKKRFDNCDAIRRTKIPTTEQGQWVIGIMVDAHIIATEYNVDPLTAVLCIRPICKSNESIFIK